MVRRHDEALEALARIDPCKSRLVELRDFGGLTVDEAAEVFEVSPGTAKRGWLLAKAWLLAELSGDREKEERRKLDTRSAHLRQIS